MLSSNVGEGDFARASQYNNLRADLVNAVKDLKQSGTVVSVVAWPSTSFPNAEQWYDIDSLSKVVSTAATCDIMITMTCAFSGNLAGEEWFRAVVGATVLETYKDDNNDDPHMRTLHWYAANVAAGSHTVKCQIYRVPSLASCEIRERRMSVIVIPRYV